MTKVEELREAILSEARGIQEHGFDTDIPGNLDSLIAAAHAEGVAEGAEQEREKIRRMQLCGYRIQVIRFPNDERRNCRVETDVDGVAYTLVPTSILAPTKESEK